MLPAFLTTFLFAISAVAANRSTRVLGGMVANFARITLATALLALWAHIWGGGFSGRSFPYFLLSGCVGFGIGDLALYQALPRIGSRLSIVLVHCLAAPFGALVEWLWLGTTLTPVQSICSLVILLGVALALIPGRQLNVSRRVLLWGILFGTVAACGQGLGAVLSRKAYQVASAAGQSVDGLTAAYQRILAGWIVTAVGFALAKGSGRGLQVFDPVPHPWRVASPWMLLNALAGPTLGVGCFQWALAICPTGVVLPIVATTPIVIIPFARLVEGELPRKRSLVGSAIAVAGAAALAGGADALQAWLRR